MMYRNFYQCPCGCTWEDEWDCQCDDRCPECNTSCSPSESEELPESETEESPPPVPVRISTYELARLSYPNGLITSGAGQDSLRRLDRVFKPSGYKANLYRRNWTTELLITSLDESMSFNISQADARNVIRAYL